MNGIFILVNVNMIKGTFLTVTKIGSKLYGENKIILNVPHSPKTKTKKKKTT